MMQRLAFLLVALAGCSFLDDFQGFRIADPARDAGVDAGDAGDAGGDGGAPSDCAGADDGVACGTGLICLDGSCRVSACGDGVVDGARGEQCDDENDVPGDGCEPERCVPSCVRDGDCDNDFVCDGQERCEDARCVPGASRDDVACTRFDGADGTCRGGYCIPPGCGDAERGANEECDGEPGCRPDCTMGCARDGDCPDANLCDDVPHCELATGECTARPAPRCDDGEPCTRDGCEPANGCTYALDDGDGDGFAKGVCADGERYAGGDCDDGDRTVYPGATEYCDGLDNDCDEARDEDAVMATCYPDGDGDGFPVQERAVVACTCPAGTMPERADARWDCWDDPNDAGRDVFPGQTAFFTAGYHRRCRDDASPCEVVFDFDFDCDGTETRLLTQGNVANCGALGGALGCTPSGFTGAPPACGSAGDYLTCTPNGGVLGGCAGSTLLRAQACR